MEDNAFQHRLASLGTQSEVIRSFESDVNNSRLPPRRKRYYLEAASALRRQQGREHLATLFLAEDVELQTTAPTQTDYLKESETDTDTNLDIQRKELFVTEQTGGVIVLHQNEIPANGVLVVTGKRDTVMLVDAVVETTRLQALQQCTVCLPAVVSSVSIDNCENCQIFVVARQLRVHDSIGLLLSGSIKSAPVLEGCEGLRMGLLPLALREVREDLLKKAELEADWEGMLEAEIFDDIEEDQTQTVREYIRDIEVPRELVDRF